MNNTRKVISLENRLDEANLDIARLETLQRYSEGAWTDALASGDTKGEAQAQRELDAACASLAAARKRRLALVDALQRARVDALEEEAELCALDLREYNQEASPLAVALGAVWESSFPLAKELNALHRKHSNRIAAFKAHVESVTGDRRRVVPLPHDARFAVRMDAVNSSIRPNVPPKFRLGPGNVLADGFAFDGDNEENEVAV